MFRAQVLQVAGKLLYREVMVVVWDICQKYIGFVQESTRR